ncbi:MAG: coproporphyrinogen III oxidase family protein [Myxococcota bacterium]
MATLVERTLLTAFKWQARHAMRMGDETHVELPSPPKRPAALYAHVPFCEVLCPFCSFHRVQFRDQKARRYFSALRDELRLYHRAGYAFSSLYVGGGTPTCAADELVETIALAKELFGVKEISVETNPLDLQPRVIEQLSRVGVSRLSVGVQSFDDRLLKSMERYEKYGSAAQIIERLDAAAPHFPTLNVDMMYDLPGQEPASLEHDLDTILGLKANQVSFYPLMTSKTSEWRVRLTMGEQPQHRVREYYERYLARLRPDFTPQSCWCFSRTRAAIDEYIVDAEDYVGVGSGAFSFIDGSLYATTFSLNTYVERISKGLCGMTGRRVLTSAERMKNLFLSRLFGLELEKAWVRERYGDEFEAQVWYALEAMKRLDAVTEDARAWRLTERGMYYWVLMMSEFFESVNRFRETMRGHIQAELDEPELRVDSTPATSGA